MNTVEADMGTLLVITTLPDENHAVKMAEALVAGQLAACVHIFPPGMSVYRWHGEIHKEREVTVLVKTVATRYAELEASIRRLHPYDVPEVIGFPVSRGLPAYLQWIMDETTEIT
ncbi:MAG TPA: divalent-cation tolerance protein CutA [Usitatibacteraceae bacterium]